MIYPRPAQRWNLLIPANHPLYWPMQETMLLLFCCNKPAKYSVPILMLLSWFKINFVQYSPPKTHLLASDVQASCWKGEVCEHDCINSLQRRSYQSVMLKPSHLSVVICMRPIVPAFALGSHDDSWRAMEARRISGTIRNCVQCSVNLSFA